MSYYKAEPTRRTVLVARKGYSDTSGVWDKIKTAFTTSADIYHQYKAGEQPAQPVMVSEGGMPGWVLPVALIGGGLVLFYVLKKRSA